jgi:hypothetical protein
METEGFHDKDTKDTQGEEASATDDADEHR